MEPVIIMECVKANEIITVLNFLSKKKIVGLNFVSKNKVVKSEVCERAHPDKNGFRIGETYYINVKNRYEWCNRYIQDKVVLDVPSGMGFGASFLKGYKKIYGVDISKEAIEEGSKRYPDIIFIQGSMTNIPIPSNSIDVTICFEGIEHITFEDQKLLFKELYRVTKNGGLVMLTVPVVYSGHKQSGNKYHIYEPTPEEVKEHINNSFSTNKIIIEKKELLKGSDGYTLGIVLEKKNGK